MENQPVDTSMTMNACARPATAAWIVFLSQFLLALGPSSAIGLDNGPSGRELGRITTRELGEVSGLAASRRNPNILWMHNDGRSQSVFAATTTGQLIARLHASADIRDFEDIAIGPGPDQDTDFLYLGDIGDNDDERREIRVVRIAEPTLGGGHALDIIARSFEEYRLTYPDGPQNAEALLVDPITGDIFIATKEKKRSRIYIVPAASLKDRTVVGLQRVANVDLAQVSGGDISPDGNRLILRRENRGLLWKRQSGETIAAALKRSPQRVPVRTEHQGKNGEAIGFHPEGRSYYSISEGGYPTISEFPMD